MSAIIIGFSLVPIVAKKFDNKLTLIGFSLAAILAVNTPICLWLLDFDGYPANGSPLVSVSWTLSLWHYSGCSSVP